MKMKISKGRTDQKKLEICFYPSTKLKISKGETNKETHKNEKNQHLIPLQNWKSQKGGQTKKMHVPMQKKSKWWTDKNEEKNISSLYENENLKRGDRQKPKTNKKRWKKTFNPSTKLKISKGGTDKETHRNEKKLSFLYKIVNFKRGTDKKERVCLYAKMKKSKKGDRQKWRRKIPSLYEDENLNKGDRQKTQQQKTHKKHTKKQQLFLNIINSPTLFIKMKKTSHPFTILKISKGGTEKKTKWGTDKKTHLIPVWKWKSQNRKQTKTRGSPNP